MSTWGGKQYSRSRVLTRSASSILLDLDTVPGMSQRASVIDRQAWRLFGIHAALVRAGSPCGSGIPNTRCAPCHCGCKHSILVSGVVVGPRRRMEQLLLGNTKYEFGFLFSLQKWNFGKSFRFRNKPSLANWRAALLWEGKVIPSMLALGPSHPPRVLSLPHKAPDGKSSSSSSMFFIC